MSHKEIDTHMGILSAKGTVGPRNINKRATLFKVALLFYAKEIIKFH